MPRRHTLFDYDTIETATYKDVAGETATTYYFEELNWIVFDESMAAFDKGAEAEADWENYWMKFYRCSNIILPSLEFHDASGILLEECHNIYIYDLIHRDSPWRAVADGDANDIHSYGVALRNSWNCYVLDGYANNTRHLITSSGTSTHSRNCEAHRCVGEQCHAATFDTHDQTTGFKFYDCKAMDLNNPPGPGPDNSVGGGFNLRGQGHTIIGGRVDNCVRGLTVSDPDGGDANHYISDFYITDVTDATPGITITSASGSRWDRIYYDGTDVTAAVRTADAAS